MKGLRANGGRPSGPLPLRAASERCFAAPDDPRTRSDGPERAEAERLDKGLHAGRGAALVALIAASSCLLAASAAAANFVKPGDSGSLTWTVQNDAQSGGPMTNVTVSVLSAPTHFIVQQTSQLGPVASIAPGGSQTFQLDYTISPDATDGETLSIDVHMSQDTPYVLNRTADTQANFPIGPWPFFDGSAPSDAAPRMSWRRVMRHHVVQP